MDGTRDPFLVLRKVNGVCTDVLQKRIGTHSKLGSQRAAANQFMQAGQMISNVNGEGVQQGRTRQPLLAEG